MTIQSQFALRLTATIAAALLVGCLAATYLSPLAAVLIVSALVLISARRPEVEPGAVFFAGLLPVLPYPVLATAAVALVLAAVTRNIRFALGFAALTLPCGVFLIDHPGLFLLLSTAVAGVTLTIAYKDALRRL